MASSDVVKKIVRFKLQLSNATEPATVLKILQKLKDLDVTLEILAETGIGKTVNSFKRHKQAGEVAKALVKGWKNLVPKESTSSKEDGVRSEKNEEQSWPDDEELPFGDESNNLTSHLKNKSLSDEASSRTKRKDNSEKQQCDQQKKKNETKKCDQEYQSRCRKKCNAEVQEDCMDNFAAPTKKKKNSDTLSGNKCMESIDRKSTFDSKEKCKIDSESGRFALYSRSKSKSSKDSSTEEESSPASGKPSKVIIAAKDEGSSRKSQSSECQPGKRKKSEGNLNTSKSKHFENKAFSEQQKKKPKMNHKHEESNSEKSLMSFESCLNYDVNDFKRKEQPGIKKALKKPKTTTKRQPAEDPETKPEKSADVSLKQKSLLHLMDVPLPATLPELEKPSVEFYFERKAEKDFDFQELAEDPAVFTGQRLNRKMQVYSGAKTLFLPAMMSLYQQCIRTLQNNINMLYETGGVPFELLEPVLERCTPEQLQRIEEYNPIYIGVTDHLWGKHCLRDFKGYKLQEYESWKEMYLRLSEERERKLKRLTKTIVSAQSKKPKGRQVKMAFIHTVAKPPRDVRIQQEIHGTAVQQPHQLKCSVKGQENRSKSSCHEPIRSSGTSTGGSNDARKKTRVAPIMAKSLKAFKKQLGRR